METGAITQYVDVAQIVLYMFWAFFAGLIYYLLRENHREGYPMDSGRENGPKIEGWPPVPEAKTFKTQDGHTYLSPDLARPDGEYSAQPTHGWNGAPLEPVGDPLLGFDRCPDHEVEPFHGCKAGHGEHRRPGSWRTSR